MPRYFFSSFPACKIFSQWKKPLPSQTRAKSSAVPPFFTGNSHCRPLQAAHAQLKHCNVCRHVTAYSCMECCPYIFGVRLQDVFAKPLPSCASHLPAALCMGVAAATSSFQSLFYIYWKSIGFAGFCQPEISLLTFSFFTWKPKKKLKNTMNDNPLHRNSLLL